MSDFGMVVVVDVSESAARAKMKDLHPYYSPEKEVTRTNVFQTQMEFLDSG